MFCLVVGACKPSRATDGASRPSSETGPATSATATGAVANGSSNSLPKIVAFGDSLSAGHGLAPDDAFTALLQQRLDQAGYHYHVVNAAVSGDTTADGVRRIDWALEGPSSTNSAKPANPANPQVDRPDDKVDSDVQIVILELGANDILRGQSLQEMKNNLSSTIDHIKARKAKVLLAGMEAPASSGAEYGREAHQVFVDLAREKQVALIPFVLDRVAGIAALNQPDGIHPNAEGERIMTDTVFKYLTPLLSSPGAGPGRAGRHGS